MANEQPPESRRLTRLRALLRARRHARERREAIVWAYRYLLGREAENREVVRVQGRSLATWQAIRANFMRSIEFTMLAPSRPSITGFEGPMDVEVRTDSESTVTLLDHVGETWSRLGASEPHHSVVTTDAFKPEQFDANAAQFYATAAQDVHRLMATLSRNGVQARANGCWLELGCGVGRMTPALAEYAGQLIAVDVSPVHIDLARERLETSNAKNVQLRRLTRVEDLDDLPELDLFFSLIVLQHNPPPLILVMLDRIFARLAEGGIAYFQVPTYRTDYRFISDEYLRTTGSNGEMEMHVVPQREVLRCATAHGLEPVEILEDERTGMRPGEVSNTFLLYKPRS